MLTDLQKVKCLTTLWTQKINVFDNKYRMEQYYEQEWSSHLIWDHLFSRSTILDHPVSSSNWPNYANTSRLLPFAIPIRMLGLNVLPKPSSITPFAYCIIQLNPLQLGIYTTCFWLVDLKLSTVRRYIKERGIMYTTFLKRFCTSTLIRTKIMTIIIRSSCSFFHCLSFSKALLISHCRLRSS